MESQFMPELTDILQDLPRVEAGPGFTAEVMSRISGRRRHVRQGWTAAAAAALLAVSLLAHREVREHQRMKEMRQEQRALAAEIQELKQMSSGSDRVYLGGTDHVDYVLDLRPDARPAGATTATSRPAAPNQHAD
jgi:hypothetical protein